MVVDIFGGSGTTGEAAEGLGRRWRTIEIDRDFARRLGVSFRQRPWRGESRDTPPPDRERGVADGSPPAKRFIRRCRISEVDRHRSTTTAAHPAVSAFQEVSPRNRPLFAFDNLAAEPHILLAGGSRREPESQRVPAHPVESTFTGRIIPSGGSFPAIESGTGGPARCADRGGTGPWRGTLDTDADAIGRVCTLAVRGRGRRGRRRAVGTARGGLGTSGRVAIRPLVRRRRATGTQRRRQRPGSPGARRLLPRLDPAPLFRQPARGGRGRGRPAGAAVDRGPR